MVDDDKAFLLQLAGHLLDQLHDAPLASGA
jgi:hypothetical protein